MSDPLDGKPLCRDADLKLMASYFTDLFRTGQARNTFVYGTPGTGKTASVRHLLNEVEKHAREVNAPVLAVFVNAGKTRTPYYTLAEIAKQLGVNVPTAGWQMFRLKQAYEHVLNEKSVLLAIDEADSIIFKEKEPLVYYLNRQPKTTLILVSNDIDDVIKLPERALSTLQPILVPMEPYTQEEMKQILTQRVEHAFKPNAITDKQLDLVAKATCEVRDVRFGFHTLLAAALMAERNHKQTIETSHIQAAIEKEDRISKSNNSKH